MAMGEPLDREDIKYLLKSYLKENLKVKVDCNTTYVGGEDIISSVEVSVMLCDEIISKDSFYS